MSYSSVLPGLVERDVICDARLPRHHSSVGEEDLKLLPLKPLREVGGGTRVFFFKPKSPLQTKVHLITIVWPKINSKIS